MLQHPAVQHLIAHALTAAPAFAVTLRVVFYPSAGLWLTGCRRVGAQASEVERRCTVYEASEPADELV